METTSTAAFAMYITFYIVLTLLSIIWIYTIISRFCRSTHSNLNHVPTTIVLFSTNREPPRGLETSVIETFPKFRYTDTDRDTSTSARVKRVSECVVCLGGFEENEMLRLLPKCGHVFHVECVDTWLQSNSTCPFCRANLLTSDRTTEVVVDIRQSRRDRREDTSNQAAVVI